MYTYIYIYIYTYIYIYIYMECVYIHICIHECVCMRECVAVCGVYVDVRVCENIDWVTTIFQLLLWLYQPKYIEKKNEGICISTFWLKSVCFSFVYNRTSLGCIGLGVRVFANGLGDLGSIPGRVIPKTQKMVLDASLLSTQHYKVRIKGKVEQSRKGVVPSPTHWCSSYQKGSLRVTLDYGRQLYFYFTWKLSMAARHWCDLSKEYAIKMTDSEIRCRVGNAHYYAFVQ